MNAGTEVEQRPWSDAQRQQFVRDGYIRVNNAFSPEVAAEARAILWRDTGCHPDDPSTWIRPVIRLNDYNQAPFRAAANTPVLQAAFDELVGPKRWIPRESLGSFPIRFPHADDPKDTGWHVDTSFPPEEPVESYFDWRVSVTSRGRALLMLFLFSDVTDQDAPTRIRLGSHLRIARRLALAGAAGMSGRDLAAELEVLTGGLPEAVATGPVGTVYLCHPFLVHAAQAHCGATPRFLAQPPLHPRVPFELERSDSDYSLVEQAIHLALSGETER